MSCDNAIRRFSCAGCAAAVEKRCPPGTKFCSLPCYRSALRPARRTGVTLACGRCGAPIYRAVSATGAASFCSTACHNEIQRKTKVRYHCKTCESVFLWSPSRTKQHLPTYCSLACRTACADWKRNAVIAGNLKQQNAKAPTRLEQAGASLLRQSDIGFREQVLVAEKFCVDVQLDVAPIVIQWDGDYWHGWRHAGDARPLDSRQARRIALDRSQDAYMRACGLSVLRFWEHEVFKQPEKVLEDIQGAIRQLAA